MSPRGRVLRLRVPLGRSHRVRGLGTMLAGILRAIGIPTCTACRRRADWLDQHVQMSSARTAESAPEAARWTDGDGAWHLEGACTGFGRRVCITMPSNQQDPLATTLTQCCGGWFQYPWIVVPASGDAYGGCGFCVA